MSLQVDLVNYSLFSDTFYVSVEEGEMVVRGYVR